MGSMTNLLILSIVIITAQAKPAPEAYAEGYGYHPEHKNYYVSPLISAALPAPINAQHHAQDELGQYEYGFNTGNTAKHELKTADGVTRGSYSYVDANGILQTTNYISDDVFGFRVAATNLPQHIVPAAHAPVAQPAAEPVVQVAPVQPVAHVPVAQAAAEPVVQVAPVQPVAQVKAEVAVPVPSTVATAPAPQIIRPTVAYTHLPYALHYGYNAALPAVVAPYAAAPAPVVQQPIQAAVQYTTPNVVAAPAPVVAAPAPATQTVVLKPALPTTHQFHAQDELGQYQFGYTEPKASRVETKTADGVVTGSYNYIDSNGVVQTVQYIADALGFRVAGTNIPQHHVVAPVSNAVAPLPVTDTAEVVAAREAHLQLVQEAQAAQPVVAVVPETVVAPVEIADDKIIAVPNIVPAEEVAAEVIPEYETDDTPVVNVVEKVLEPYVPPPVPTFYKAADPVKVAAAFEQQLGVVAEQTVVAPTPIAQLSYTVGQAPVAAPVVTPVAVQPTVYVTQPQVVATAPIVAPQQVPVAAAPVFIPPYANQHHAQDEYGQYQYGYTNEDSAKLETRLADGSVRGTYSYIDANGIVQRVDYISDALGFRVAATNLPTHTPCVEGQEGCVAPAPATPVVAPAAPVVAPAEKVVSGFVVPNVYTPVQPVVQQVPVVSQETVAPVAPAAVPIAVAAPSVAPIPYYVNPHPVAAPPTIQTVPYASQYGYQQVQYVPAAPTTSQHHAQSELGEYAYGYQNVNSAKTETKTIDGVTRGSYTYVDANNILQRVDYIADDLYGFRVAATNLPVAPAVAPVPVAVAAPEVVAPEVDSTAVIEE